MDAPAKVMIIGNSLPYLESRAKVLRNFWMVEMVALDLGQVPNFKADLLVVSASVPEPERQRLVEMARAQTPLTLIVRTDGYDSGPLSSADATVDEERGPGALVSTIYELLTERGLPSRGWPKLYQGEWLQ
jgi:hypothetical protein